MHMWAEQSRKLVPTSVRPRGTAKILERVDAPNDSATARTRKRAALLGLTSCNPFNKLIGLKQLTAAKLRWKIIRQVVKVGS